MCIIYMHMCFMCVLYMCYTYLYECIYVCAYTCVHIHTHIIADCSQTLTLRNTASKRADGTWDVQKWRGGQGADSHSVQARVLFLESSPQLLSLFSFCRSGFWLQLPTDAGFCPVLISHLFWFCISHCLHQYPTQSPSLSAVSSRISWRMSTKYSSEIILETRCV